MSPGAPGPGGHQSNGFKVAGYSRKWQGNKIYTKVGGVPYLVDAGAEVSMTRRDLETTGHLQVQFADERVEEMPYGTWK